MNKKIDRIDCSIINTSFIIEWGLDNYDNEFFIVSSNEEREEPEYEEITIEIVLDKTEAIKLRNFLNKKLPINE